MKELAILTLMALVLAGCSSTPPTPTMTNESPVCTPKTVQAVDRVISHRGSHNVTAQGGYLSSGPYADVRWVWPGRGPVEVSIQATWSMGPLNEDAYRLRGNTEADNQPLGDARGPSPLYLNFTVTQSPGHDADLRIFVEPTSDPNMPVGAAIVKADTEVTLVVTQTRTCP